LALHSRGFLAARAGGKGAGLDGFKIARGFLLDFRVGDQAEDVIDLAVLKLVKKYLKRLEAPGHGA
jgi:hypothetical protein